MFQSCTKKNAKVRKMIKNTKVIVKDRRDKAKSAIKTKKTN